MSETESITRDNRIDRVAAWALCTIATLAISLGAWTINSFSSRLDRQNASLEQVSVGLGHLTSRIAVLEAGLQDVSEMRRINAELTARVIRLEERLNYASPPR